ncbi:MAG TPA: DMT family transporter [Actinomycetota bacterium]|nr:DMT family transporter [Actinomycetota bacterium]
MTNRSRLPVAELSLVFIAAVWGLTFPMVQDAIALLPTFTFLAYRFLAAFAIVLVVFGRRLPRLGRAGVRAGARMGVFLTAGYALQTLGLEQTTASKAGFITGLFVVLTPVLGALLFGQRAGAVAWSAALVSALGMFLLSGAGGGFNAGDALVLGCACSFALHILVTEPAVKVHDAGALLVVQLGVCGFVCLTVAAGLGDLAVPREMSVWVALAVTAIVASALGFFVQTWAQKHSPPARTALILASEPAFAGLFAYLLKGEVLDARGWVGASLILLSILVVELMPYLRPARPLPEG